MRKVWILRGMSFSFGDLMAPFLRGYHIEKEAANYLPQHDLKGLDVIKTMDPRAPHSPMLSFVECNAHNGHYMNLMYDITILQVRLCGVTKEKLQQLNSDYLDEQIKDDSDSDPDDKEGEYSEKGDPAYAPTDDEQ
ncbi:hypothetical protein HAX54_052465, partial [Datura stramonium]|nr:hypothetical protein [Datura stramonium]